MSPPLESVVVSAIRVFLAFSPPLDPKENGPDDHDDPDDYSQDHQYPP